MASGTTRTRVSITVTSDPYWTDESAAVSDVLSVNGTWEAPNGQPYQLRFNYAEAELMLQYQAGWYTLLDFCVRVLLLFCTVVVFARFRRRLWGRTRRTPEQNWVPPLLLSLAVYLNPLAFISAVGSFGNTTTGLVFEFIEFHAATYFTLLFQLMYICLILRMRGKLPLGLKIFWAIWFILMVAADATVAVVDNGPSSDYTSTYIGWALSRRASHLSIAALCLYAGGLFLAAVWLVSAVVATHLVRGWLKKMQYGPTRRTQLTFRSLVFMIWTYVISRTACLLSYWWLLGRYELAYRSSDETGTVVLSSCLAFSIVYQFSPADPRGSNVPPHPGEPTWESPRWRRCKWTDVWYDWLRDHGGALYYFVHEEELDKFTALQNERVCNLMLLSATSGWPVRQEPSFTAPIVDTLTSGVEVQVIKMPNGWNQLLDGYFMSEDENVEGYWEDPARMGFTLQTISPHYRRQRKSRFRPDHPPLFFCVEIASHLADLSYSTYYPPGPEDYARASMAADSFAWSLSVEFCGLSLVSVASIVAAVATGLSAAPCVLSMQPQQEDSPLSSPGVSPGNSPPGTPKADGGRHIPLTADLKKLGLRLCDVIELAGTQAFVTVPEDGSRRVLVAFRGSDSRFHNVNLISDLRFGRQVWRTMTGATTGGCGCCTQPLLHRGFMEMWEKSRGGHAIHGPLQDIPLRDAVLRSVERAIRSFGQQHKVTVYCTGHSLGGALACLLAYSLKQRRGVDSVVYTFGLPRLGNRAFTKLYDATVPNTFRLVYEYDPVVHVSGTFCNHHVGKEVCIDRHGSLLVEPTWVEKTFSPTKSMAIADMGGHGLDSYLQSLDRVFLRSGSTKKCKWSQRAAKDDPPPLTSVPGTVRGRVEGDDTDLCQFDVGKPDFYVPDDSDLHELTSLSPEQEEKYLESSALL